MKKGFYGPSEIGKILEEEEVVCSFVDIKDKNTLKGYCQIVLYMKNGEIFTTDEVLKFQKYKIAKLKED